MIDVITADFETEGIVGNPIVTPPKPVGCAVWIPGEEPIYYSWGSLHNDNNITYDQFHQYLARIRESGFPLLFHNAAFDISVWNAYFCNARLEWINQGWRRIYDTLFLVFLADPYASTFSLKPSADRYLGMAPGEQTDLHNWIMANVPEATAKTAGAYICRAPASLVGPYAIGDVVRTRKLHDLLHAKIIQDGMEQAYDRERRLLPILMAGTARGIRINRSLLDYHTEVYSQCEVEAANRLSALIGVDVSGDISDERFADALEACGAVTEWTLTPKSGKRSLSKDNLRIVRPDVKLLLDYRSNLQTCLQTFMRPWLAKSTSDGRLHPNWNQVRQARENGFSKGTRTGRLSSDDPNFQNVPTEFVDLSGNPLPVPEGLHPLPQLRSYCLPEEGHVWIKRDFSSQEIRIVAHFEDGSLLEAYRAKPDLDPHKMAMEIINTMLGVLYARKKIKITSFAIVYGAGAPGLSGQLGSSLDEARGIKSAYLDAMPGIRNLMHDVQARGRRGEAIRTWGGRLYLAEPAKMVAGQWRSFEYKLLNYLIQGSAADQTKESICDWEDTRSWEDMFIATVHDEINISAPKEQVQRAMQTLQTAMDKDRFDCPMRSEGFTGSNWQDIEEYKDAA